MNANMPSLLAAQLLRQWADQIGKTSYKARITKTIAAGWAYMAQPSCSISCLPRSMLVGCRYEHPYCQPQTQLSFYEVAEMGVKQSAASLTFFSACLSNAKF